MTVLLGRKGKGGFPFQCFHWHITAEPTCKLASCKLAHLHGSTVHGSGSLDCVCMYRLCTTVSCNLQVASWGEMGE